MKVDRVASRACWTFLAHPTPPHPTSQPEDVSHAESSQTENEKKHNRSISAQKGIKRKHPVMQDQRAHVYFPQYTAKMNTSTLLHIRMRLQKYAVYRRQTPGAVGIHIYFIYTLYNHGSLVIILAITNQSSHNI